MNDRHQKTAYPLRMPEDLRAQLEKSAFEVGRSLNAEIVARLQQTFSTDARQPKTVVVENFDEFMASVLEEVTKRITGPVVHKAIPQFSDQADDMPMDPPKRRVNTKRKI